MKLDLRSAEEIAGFLARLGIYTPEQMERRIVADHGVRQAQAREIVSAAIKVAAERQECDRALVEADQKALHAEHNC